MSNFVIILIILAAMIIAAPVAAQPGGGMAQSFIFRKMDSNGDGKVDQQEYHAAMQARFDQTDVNKDGQLTQEELAARMEQVQELRKLRRQGGSQ